MDTSIIVAIIGAAGLIISAYIGKEKNDKYKKEELELNTSEDIPSAFNLSEISGTKNDKGKELVVSKNVANNHVIEKISKDHGPDEKNGWKLRTFYTISKKQLFEKEYISFKIRDNENINIILKCSELINKFDLENENETVSDGAGKIRICIFQEKHGKQNFYIVRFGKKMLEEPVMLQIEK